jgi:hypothetical protein
MMARSDRTNVALSAAAIVCTVLVAAPGRAQAQEHPALSTRVHPMALPRSRRWSGDGWSPRT